MYCLEALVWMEYLQCLEATQNCEQNSNRCSLFVSHILIPVGGGSFMIPPPSLFCTLTTSSHWKPVMPQFWMNHN